MTQVEPKFNWAKQNEALDFEVIECPDYDPYKDFKMEPTGHYALIKVNFELYRIEAGICNKEHKIIKVFRGKKPQDVYHAIFQYEKKNNLQWFQDKSHIAYLGKELKKAEIALVTGQNMYFQE